MSWFKAHPWTMAIALAVGLAAVAGVVYALVTHRRRMAARDKGLMVRDGHELRWLKADMPLAVWFDPKLPERLQQTWEVAVAVFESALGRPLFLRGIGAPAELDLERLPRGNVAVRCNDGQRDLASDHGRTEPRYDKRSGELWAALVTLPELTRTGLEKHVAIHEIGHVLGLDHDDDRASIMFPTLSMRREPGTLSDKDIELLKGLYL